MKQFLWQAFVVATLIGVGWSAGLAQTSRSAFELTVVSGPGFATVRCNSGCELYYVNAGRPTASNTFTLTCEGAKPCLSQTIGGQIKP